MPSSGFIIPVISIISPSSFYLSEGSCALVEKIGEESVKNLECDMLAAVEDVRIHVWWVYGRQGSWVALRSLRPQNEGLRLFRVTEVIMATKHPRNVRLEDVFFIIIQKASKYIRNPLLTRSISFNAY